MGFGPGTGGGGAGLAIPTPPTAGGLTMSSKISSLITYRFDWTNAMIVALTGTKDKIKVCTLLAGTIIKEGALIVDTAATNVSALTGAVGYTASNYNEIIGINQNLKATANTVYGKATASGRGNNLSSGSTGTYQMFDVPSLVATTDLYIQFDAGSDNLSSVLTCSGHVLISVYNQPAA